MSLVGASFVSRASSTTLPGSALSRATVDPMSWAAEVNLGTAAMTVVTAAPSSQVVDGALEEASPWSETAPVRVGAAPSWSEAAALTLPTEESPADGAEVTRDKASARRVVATVAPTIDEPTRMSDASTRVDAAAGEPARAITRIEDEALEAGDEVTRVNGEVTRVGEEARRVGDEVTRVTGEVGHVDGAVGRTTEEAARCVDAFARLSAAGSP